MILDLNSAIPQLNNQDSLTMAKRTALGGDILDLAKEDSIDQTNQLTQRE